MATKTPDFSKVGDFLEKNSKPIIYIVGGVVIIILAKKLLSGLFNKYPSNPANLEINTSQLSITQAQAMQIAQNMFEAMNRFGTDEETLFDSVTPLNNEDLKLVCKVFGLRSYFGHGYGAIFGQDKSLQGWLKAELSGKNLEDMQQLFIAKGQAF